MAESGSLRERIWRVVFRSDTKAGRVFDLGLMCAIAVSVLVVMLESVATLSRDHGTLFRRAEWTFTIVFTIEYLVRLWVVPNRVRYAFSFFGIVDAISFMPTYLELFVTGSHYMMTLRSLRLLRMFRVLKLAHYLGEAQVLINALRASRAKIAVFLFALLGLVCVEGTLMYLLEHNAGSGFDNIPQSIYWAIVTITTVGYGDISPATVLGKMMASIIMLTGFAIIAVPTGVVTAELGREIVAGRLDRRRCGDCGWEGHDRRAKHCHQCGAALD